MKYFNLLYYFISFSTGFIGLCMMSLLYIKFRTKFIKYYLIWLTLYTGILIFNSTNFFVSIYMFKLFGIYNDLTIFLYFIAFGFMIYTCALMFHHFAGLKFVPLKKTIFGSVILLTAVLPAVPHFLANDFIYLFGYMTISFRILFIVSISFNVYILLFILNNYKKITSLEKRLFLKFVFILTAVFIPPSFLEYFWNRAHYTSAITFSNLNYFLINLVSILFFYKYLFINPKFSMSRKLPEAFTAKYDITDREKEIIINLLTGLVNKEIAGALNISNITVKNHIYNIYQKTGAQNKLELLKLIDDEMLVK